jgi:hypothetical protein
MDWSTLRLLLPFQVNAKYNHPSLHSVNNIGVDEVWVSGMDVSKGVTDFYFRTKYKTWEIEVEAKACFITE